MNQMEQIGFLNELTSAVVARLTERVLAGRVPTDWDGHELRCLLRHAFSFEAARTRPEQHRRTKYGKTVADNILDLYP